MSPIKALERRQSLAIPACGQWSPQAHQSNLGSYQGLGPSEITAASITLGPRLASGFSPFAGLQFVVYNCWHSAVICISWPALSAIRTTDSRAHTSSSSSSLLASWRIHDCTNGSGPLSLSRSWLVCRCQLHWCSWCGCWCSWCCLSKRGIYRDNIDAARWQTKMRGQIPEGPQPHGHKYLPTYA